MREIHGLIAQDGNRPANGQDVTVREWVEVLQLRIGHEAANLTCDEALRLAGMLRDAVKNIQSGKTK